VKNMKNNDTVEEKRCFVITPIGNPETTLWRHMNGIIDAAIVPVLNEFSFKPIIPHRIDGSGSITKEIIVNLFDDELVIANLSGLNANVMYEVAVRHSFRKKIIIIAEKGVFLPFDIKDQRTIFYENDAQGVIDLKNELRKKISSILNEDEINISNVVYDSLQGRANREYIIENIGKKGESKEEIDFRTFMMDQFEILQRDMTTIKRSIGMIEKENNDEFPFEIMIETLPHDKDINDFKNIFQQIFKELGLDFTIMHCKILPGYKEIEHQVQLLLKGRLSQRKKLNVLASKIEEILFESYEIVAYIEV